MPWAPSSRTGTSSSASSAGASEPLTQPTCEQATSTVFGPAASATSREGDFADADAVQLAGGAESAEQARVLLVAGDDLIAGGEADPGDHVGHAFGRAGGQRDVRGLRAEQPRHRPRGAGRPARCAVRNEPWPGPRSSSRSSSARAASTARVGRGPSVPAFMYAVSRSTGNRRAASGLHDARYIRDRRASAARGDVRRSPSTRATDLEAFAGAARGGRDGGLHALGRRPSRARFRRLRRAVAWSVDELEEFWADIWEFCDVRASHPYERVLASREMPGPSGSGARELNYAENLISPATIRARSRSCTARSCVSSPS